MSLYRFKEKHCSQYQGGESFLCQAALKVNVDPNWNYACEEGQYTQAEYQCNKTLIVVCEESPNCTEAGIKTGSTQADMHLSMRPHDDKDTYKITFGTIADNYWWDNIFDRQMSFEIHGHDRLRQFSLTHLAYDDWLVVKVNDVIVYSSAPNLRPLKVRWASRAKYSDVIDEETEQYYGRMERSRSWKFWPNIDIRPYLKEGKNTIWTRTLVAGGGESAVEFLVNQYCQPKCQERWDDQCSLYHERTSR